jgi:colanic acid biosynthesis glycosyl transferase WcaI
MTNVPTIKIMRLLFLNQYAPPDPSPTARLMGELIDNLRSQGHKVEIICQDSAYQGHHIRMGNRMRRELGALGTILRIGLCGTDGRKPDLIVSLSSPPCLLIVAALISLHQRVPLAHWAMDLYPELAIALGEIPARSPVVPALRLMMRWAYRRCVLIVALDDDMAAHLQRFYGVVPRVLAPWPPSASQGAAEASLETSPGARMATDMWTWLYSGNLGRAHEWQPMLDVQAELERRGLPIQLVFEGGGPNWQPAQAYAERKGLLHCRWTGYVSESMSFQSLQASRLIVATQKRGTMGLLWPSKLARVIPLNKPMLWIGPEDGAVARSLSGRRETACFEPNRTINIAEWIENLHLRKEVSFGLSIDGGQVEAGYKRLIKAACQQWEHWLQEAAARF